MKLNFDHYFRLIDETAIVEHANGSVPNNNEGYSLDDVARALQVSVRFWQEDERMAKVLPRLFDYVERAAAEDGFLNDLENDGTWKPVDMKKGEHFGRVMVALAELGWTGVVIEPYRTKARKLFEKYGQYTLESLHPRVWAQMIIAWCFRLLSEESEVGTVFVETLNQRLVEMFRKESKEGWNWFEPVVSYDNGRLIMAIWAAYRLTKKEELREVASQSLNLLVKGLYDSEKGYFTFPGNRGWWSKGGQVAKFDQQPVEAASMVEALVMAYQVGGEEIYSTLAKRAWQWYQGRNIMGAVMIDEKSGGIMDGFGENGVNKNQGAEAILSYLLAADAMRRAGLLE